MKNRIKLIAIALCSVNITACVMDEEGFNSNYARYYTYESTSSYPTLNYQPTNYKYSKYYSDRPSKMVTVPDSYHVGEYHSPVSFKDRDREWVGRQNPQAYTIEVADDEKAAKVAQTLSKTPKNDRMAEVKYQRNGKSYYKGIYGTYNNAEAAQKAYESLPPDVKQGAGIKTWSSIQNNLD